MPPAKRRNISQRSEMVYDIQNFGILIDSREIFLYSDMSYDYDNAMLDYKAANNFIKNLQVLNSFGNETILVHMITNGGDWNYGMAIYDAIKNSCEDESLSNIIILAYAHARSMSSIIPQAATWRVMMPNSDFLIHYGTFGIGETNYQSAWNEMAWANKQTENMLDIYVERCKDGDFWKRERMDEKAIRQWIIDELRKTPELYMTAREAVDRGFMDAVLGDEDFESISVLRA